MKKRLNLFTVFRDVWRVAPVKFFWEYFFTAVDGIALALTAVALEKLFAAVLLFAEGKIFVWDVLRAVLVLLLLYLASEAGSGIASYLGETYSGLTVQKMRKRIHEKQGRFHTIDFEEPEFLNEMQRACAGAWQQRAFANIIMDILTLYLPYFLIYGVYLYRRKPVLALAIPLIFLPKLLAQVIKSRMYLDLEEKTAPLARKEEAYASYAAERDYVKETRLLNTVDIFIERWRGVRSRHDQLILKVQKRAYFAEIAALLLHLAGYAGVIGILLVSVFKGDIAVSAFAAVFASLSALIEQMDELIGERFGELAENYAGIKNYRAFMERETAPQEGGELEEYREINLKKVCFSYPGGEDVLKDIDLTINERTRLAVVGENGSGKTTLARLILGLYIPTEGEVCYNGISTARLCYGKLQKQASAVFQNFRKYKMTLCENIDIAADEPAAQMGVEEALNQAGITLSKEVFPEHLNTMLAKEFGGVDLSGGQWQRIAIARGIYKKSGLIVLDEPTAAIDPMQEYELYQTFLNVAKEKIAVIVTHRLGLAKACDKIIVMQEGRILDAGCHEELLARCEYYKRLWDVQAAGYVTAYN